MRREIEIRLQDWGNWRVRPVRSLDYPSMSPIMRINNGGRSMVVTVATYSPKSKESKLNQIILDMPKSWQRALHETYARAPEDTDKDKAWTRIGWGRRKYFDVLGRSEAYLMGRLGLTY